MQYYINHALDFSISLNFGIPSLLNETVKFT